MKERSPWIAAILSLVATGVGHIYCGKIVKGVVLFGVWLLLLVGSAIAARIEPSTTALVVLLVLPSIALVAIYVGACFDAWSLAGRQGGEYRMRDYNHPAVYAILLAVGAVYPFLVMNSIRSSAFEGFRIAEHSMVPTLVPGDLVLANKFLSSEAEPIHTGDVVIFESPERPGATWVKRVVGLPGDEVEIRAGGVFVNDEEVGEWGEARAGEMEPVTVPESSAFVLGDNLGGSRDSRHFGAIPLRDVTGVVEYVYLPKGNWGRFGRFR